MIESAGTHVTIDAFVRDVDVFNEDTLYILFDDLVQILKSEFLARPRFYEVPIDPEILRKSEETGEFHDEGGLTAFCVITKSHISLHAWPLQSFFSMDIFSCGKYDPEEAIDTVKGRMGIRTASVTIMERKKRQPPKVKSLIICS